MSGNTGFFRLKNKRKERRSMKITSKASYANLRKPTVLAAITLIVAAMIIPAAMAATLTPSQLTYYFPDDQTATLYGSEFQPNSNVTITITIAENSDYYFTDTVMSDEYGNFVYDYALTGIPLTYLVTAVDEAGNTATTTFFDPPAITLDPTSDPVGTTVTISGSGFHAGDTITVTFDSTPVSTDPTTVTASNNPGGGSFTCTFEVPPSSAGAHTVTASDTHSGSASATFIVVKTATFGLDAVGSASHTGSGDVTVALTNLGANDVIIVMFGSDNPGYTVSSVTDGSDLTYTHRSTTSLPVIYTGQELVDEYWAVTSSAISSDTITVHVSGSGGTPHFVVIAFAISGANTNSPFDVDSGLPYTANDQNSVPSVTGVSTSYANDIIIGLEGHTGGTLETAGSGYLLITSSNDEVGSAEFKSVTSTLSSETVSFGTSVNAKWAMIVDAIKAPPQITLDPTSGNVGDTVSISGSGFDASSAITATYDGSPLTLGDTTTTDADGSFTGATFTVPESTAGGHTVEVTDVSSNFADATFTVTPKITLNPTSGPVGTSVTVTGTGFAGTSTITIKFDGVTQTTTLPTVTTDSDGSFTASFDVPSASLGDHTVSATDEDDNTASATFTVTGSGFCVVTSRGWVEIDTFKLIFTPDVPANPNLYRLTASNPGQFSYNVFDDASAEDDVYTITIPYPFVTQGANPVLIYDTAPIDNVPTGNVINSQFTIVEVPVTLDSYSDGTVTVTITNNGYSGPVYITIHLDYGLKKVAGGYTKMDNNAKDSTSWPNILDDTTYDFSVADALGCHDSITNVNVFKHDPGIGGLVLDSDGNPMAGVTVQIYSGTKVTSKSLVATLTTDEDGWYMWNYKYTGKPASFTIVANGQTQTVTLKANGFLVVNFGVT
jgi:hypothetical protein